ncbi:MAG: hypothetical protein WB511_10245 [Nitrososphaeraceae archaeon]
MSSRRFETLKRVHINLYLIKDSLPSLMDVLNPRFNIKSLQSSIFGYSMEIEIGSLPPNEIFELRDFGPDGEALSGRIGLKSDINPYKISLCRN